MPSSPNFDAPASDPWGDAVPQCLLCGDAPDLRARIEMNGAGRIVPNEADATDGPAIVLVDCRLSGDAIGAARRRFAGSPIVAIVARFEAARVIELLARGADGVVALHDPPEDWRACLLVVRGGGRWLGGPGLEVSLEEKLVRYGVARGEHLAGDVTLRTQQFVRGRVSDKLPR